MTRWRMVAVTAVLAGCGQSETGLVSADLSISGNAVERAATPEAMAAVAIDTSDVRMTPSDLMTATSSTMPELLVIDARPELPLSEQREWIRRATLREWPSRREVAVTGHYVAPLADRGDRGHRFVFEPRHPLSTRWYGFEVDMRGATGHAIQTGLHARGRGRWVARFRVDSHAIAQSLRTQADGDATLIEILLSERVFATAEDVRLRVGGEDIPCEMLTQFVHVEDDLGLEEPGVPPNTSVGGGPASALPPESEAQARVALRCETRLSETAELDLSDQVVTVLGTPVYGPNDRTPARITWEPEDADDLDDESDEGSDEAPVRVVDLAGRVRLDG